MLAMEHQHGSFSFLEEILRISLSYANDRSASFLLINVTRTDARLVHVAKGRVHGRASTHVSKSVDPRLYVISPRLERGSQKLCE